MEMASWDPTRKDSCWLCAGMPVMGSRRVFSCAMLHAGEILRSDDEFADAIIRGTSAALWRDMLMAGAPLLLLQDELVRQLVIGGKRKCLEWLTPHWRGRRWPVVSERAADSWSGSPAGAAG